MKQEGAYTTDPKPLQRGKPPHAGVKLHTPQHLLQQEHHLAYLSHLPSETSEGKEGRKTSWGPRLQDADLRYVYPHHSKTMNQEIQS